MEIVTNEDALTRPGFSDFCIGKHDADHYEELTLVVGEGGELYDPDYEEAREALESLIETVEGMDRGTKYTDESLKALDEALTGARDALANAETAEELWNAYDKLEGAINGLVEKTTDGNDSESPDTGDYDIGFAAMVMMIAAGALFGVFFVRKHKHS